MSTYGNRRYDLMQVGPGWYHQRARLLQLDFGYGLMYESRERNLARQIARSLVNDLPPFELYEVEEREANTRMDY